MSARNVAIMLGAVSCKIEGDAHKLGWLQSSGSVLQKQHQMKGFPTGFVLFRRSVRGSPLLSLNLHC